MSTHDIAQMKPIRRFNQTNERDTYFLVAGKTALGEVSLRIPVAQYLETQGAAIEPAVEELLRECQSYLTEFEVVVDAARKSVAEAHRTLLRKVRSHLATAPTSASMSNVDVVVAR